MEGSGRVA
jgi:hypothetical protein